NELTSTTTGNSCNRVYTKTWDATDACNNHSATRTQVITAIDTHAPTIGGAGADATIGCLDTPSFTPPTASDDCSGATVNNLGDVTQANGDGSVTTTRSWDATDACGNHSLTRSQSITTPVCTGHLFPTATTCCSFKNGSAQAFTQVCFTVKGNGPHNVTNATPGVFFYYAKIIAPSASF